MLLCVGPYPDLHPPAGSESGGRPYTTETLPGKGMWKKMSAITGGLSCLSGSQCGWAVKGSELRQEQSTAPLW